jgi:peptidyl-prolyl cis-trans isomerase A (cyclophilin A)
LSRRRNLQQSRPQQLAPAGAPMLEPLEGRQLLASAAAIVTSTLADNRGYVEIRFNKGLQSKTVNTKSVRLFTPGADKVFGTIDDVKVTSKVSYSSSKKTVIINAQVPTDVSYRVKLYSSIIKDVDGLAIDGEFKSGGKSGNGTAGGNYQFRVKRDTGATPIAHFLGNIGNIDVRLFRGASSYSNVATPGTVANFLKYVNSGSWDTLWINRLVNGFIAQMGTYKLTSTGKLDIVASQTDPGDMPGEPGNSNVAGTLAFALPSEPDAQTQGLHSQDAGTNQFFFNLASNTFLDTLQGNPAQGPFTVFGKVTGAKSMAVLNAISSLKRLDLQSFRPTDPTGSLKSVAVRPSVPVQGDAGGGFSGGTTNKVLNTFQDLVVFSRVSILSKVVAA